MIASILAGDYYAAEQLLEGAVMRLWWRPASALRYFALAARWIRLRTAPQFNR